MCLPPTILFEQLLHAYDYWYMLCTDVCNFVWCVLINVDPPHEAKISFVSYIIHTSQERLNIALLAIYSTG